MIQPEAKINLTKTNSNPSYRYNKRIPNRINITYRYRSSWGSISYLLVLALIFITLSTTIIVDQTSARKTKQQSISDNDIDDNNELIIDDRPISKHTATKQESIKVASTKASSSNKRSASNSISSPNSPSKQVKDKKNQNEKQKTHLLNEDDNDDTAIRGKKSIPLKEASKSGKITNKDATRSDDDDNDDDTDDDIEDITYDFRQRNKSLNRDDEDGDDDVDDDGDDENVDNDDDDEDDDDDAGNREVKSSIKKQSKPSQQKGTTASLTKRKTQVKTTKNNVDDDNNDDNDDNNDDDDNDEDEDEIIEDITDADTLNKLIEANDHIMVFFYDKEDPKIHQKANDILKQLETIDDDCDDYDIGFVKIDNDQVAREFGLMDELPALVYFEHQLPSIYEGSYKPVSQVLDWILKQKSEDTIEEVTDEILEKLLIKHPYVLVFFAPNSCTTECEIILQGLESIDDDTDEYGILFVTTDDMDLARKRAKITKFPTLVLFRNNGDSKTYKGNLKKPDEVLKWVTSEEALDITNAIDLVNRRMFEKLLNTSNYLAVVFIKDKCKNCDKVLQILENIDHLTEDNDIDLIKINDVKLAREFNLVDNSLPALVFFKHRYPHIYQGNLLARDADQQVLKWLNDEKNNQEEIIELVSGNMLDILLDNMKHLVVFFYDPKLCGQDTNVATGNAQQQAANLKCKRVLQELENIDDDTDDNGIQFVKCEDVKYAKTLGISQLPALVYFEESSSAPSIYLGDLEEEEKVLEWLLKQKNEDTIENINKDILNKMIAQQQGDSDDENDDDVQKEYVACLFYKLNHEDSDDIVETLEHIDDDLSEYDIHLVKMADDLIAKKYGIRHPPGLVLFRHGLPLKYEGDLFDTDELIDWLTNPATLETNDAIEQVNEKMFERFRVNTNYLAVLFYSETNACKQCKRVMEELEKIDDEASSAGIRFIKVDNMDIARRYGIHALPALVFITTPLATTSTHISQDQSQAIIYAGDLKKGEKILEWLMEQKSPNLHQIEDLNGRQCRELIKTTEHVAIFFYNNDNDEDSTDDCDDRCALILAGLENIDGDCKKHSISLVKTNDKSMLKEFGIQKLPALVYLEHGNQPSIYQGDLNAEEDCLDWLIQQKTEDTIEEVNRGLFEHLIESSHYLVALFYKPHCKSCTVALEKLESIDDDCDLYGITMVKIQDIPLAKRYGIKTFPALVYFRNGNPLIFDGDLRNEQQVLEWLIEDENRELSDEIEDINGKMLDRLIDSSPFLAALFYDDDCQECPKVLRELEKIDDDTDLFGIDFVKINDFAAARKYNVHSFPTLVYFRKQSPSYYDGDLLDEESVLRWLTSNDVFELEDEIEEVNRRMLDKLMETNDYIAVYFYDKNCPTCDAILKELEGIDDEADSLDIMFVKIKDMNYAKKYGITQVPSLVYFRKKFPSIYRGDLMREEKVLEWLRKNRYRNPELNLFMYALFSITISFIFYTIFLMFCVKKKQE